MAKFVGNGREFKRYVGPFLRNLVQQITKKYKQSVGACEHCGAINRLQAAHVADRDRTEIIDQLLAASDNDSVVEVDLVAFENEFKEEHFPIEDCILILCKDCHLKYDRKQDRPLAGGPTSSTGSRQVLPILFDPSDTEEFKTLLLDQKWAVIEVHYADGRVVEQEWNAVRFSTTSNLLGNLRSRPEFRSGKWQAEGIVHVYVRILGIGNNSSDV